MRTGLQYFREPIFVALETLRTHKMRSFLMLLGIVLSVSTLIMVVALISGVNLYVENRIANLGSNVFLVLRFPIITDMTELVKATRRNKPITWDDYVFLRDNSKLALRVGAQANLRRCLAHTLRGAHDSTGSTVAPGQASAGAAVTPSQAAAGPGTPDLAADDVRTLSERDRPLGLNPDAGWVRGCRPSGRSGTCSRGHAAWPCS